jgi:hypothetical protein
LPLFIRQQVPQIDIPKGLGNHLNLQLQVIEFVFRHIVPKVFDFLCVLCIVQALFINKEVKIMRFFGTTVVYLSKVIVKAITFGL